MVIYLLAHAGDGNMHPLMTYDPGNKDEADRVENIVREIFEASIGLGGTITGEHGVGLAKKEFLPLEYGETRENALAQHQEGLRPQRDFESGEICLKIMGRR